MVDWTDRDIFDKVLVEGDWSPVSCIFKRLVEFRKEIFFNYNLCPALREIATKSKDRFAPKSSL